jgi:serine phosphatase RsbU (regulator of sigma subunit)
LIPAGADAFYFALGDVSGKGVAASMLMSHLHATLRTLLPSNRTIEEVVTTAISTFCQSALPAQFATLVLGKAYRSGKVELVNAGHNPVLLVEGTEVEIIAAASLPLGMFCSTEFASVKRRVSSETTLFLYSDGITESTDEAGNEFDLNRLAETLLQSRNGSHLSSWKQSNAPSLASPMVRNQAMTAQCLRFAGHRKEFEQWHITTSCSSVQEIPRARSWPRQS